VRHLRMLGGVALLAIVATALFAVPAMAKKSPYNENTWGQYKACPYEKEYSEVTDCFAGITAGGSEGGFFEYGLIKVKLNKPISLQGGFKGAGSEIEVVPATHGYETLESPEFAVTKGLKVITPLIQEEAEWPQSLKESFKAALKAKEGTANIKIEMAGNECFEVPGCLDTESILFEEGTAFRLPLKVKITSPWLTTLGGSGPCLIGNDENPIHINLTTSGAGRAGTFSANEEFTNLNFANTKLVDVGWHIPKVSGASGCGNAENEAFIDKALNIALEVEYPQGAELTGKKGLVVLTGGTHDAAKSAVVTTGFESGELP
jgi:hypothetical protein